MTRLGIIRHGSTAWNKEGRAQGSSDIPLDEDGIAGARKLADRLCNEDWQYICSSHLSRARQTAEIVAKGIGLANIELDVRLREAGGGQIEGTTEEERIRRWGNNWRELDLGIESSDMVVERGLPVINEIISKYTHKNVLIVSHGSWIRHLLRALVPHVNLETPLRNTSLTVIKKIDDRFECELINCTKHLNEE